MEWQLSRQWVSRDGSGRMPNRLTTSQQYRTASAVTMARSTQCLTTRSSNFVERDNTERCQFAKLATAYHVADNTPVGKMSAKQLLSSTTTKDELTVYLAKEALHHFEGKPKVFIATAQQDVLSNWMMFNISAAPKKKMTQESSCTVWMLLEEGQQSSTFS